MVQLTPHHRRARDERGGVAVFAILFMSTVLFSVGALVVDLGLGRDTRQASQITADASALAAAQALYPDSLVCTNGAAAPCYADAVTAAVSYAEQNFGVTDWSSCPSAPSGFSTFTYSPPGDANAVSAYRCISFDSLSTPSKVYMYVPARSQQTIFGGSGNGTPINSLTIQTGAEASVTMAGTPTYRGCVICVLSTANKSVDDSGGTKFVANNGNIGFNGTTSWSGSASVTVTGGSLTLQNPPTTTGGANVGPYTTSSAGVTDPIGFLPQPPPETAPLLNLSSTNTNAPCVLLPGRYNAINVPSGVTCVLGKGVYVITGKLNLSGSAVLDGSAGVTLYFTCGTAAAPADCPSSGAAGGYLNMSGQSAIKINPPTSGSTQGLSIFYDRHNTSPIALSGSSVNAVAGTIYALSSLLAMSGGTNTGAINSMLVVSAVTLSGGGTVTVNYTTANNVPVATTSTPGGVYLSK